MKAYNSVGDTVFDLSRLIRSRSSQVDTYPLNQGQISVFTEDLLKLNLEKGKITLWDIYNVATELYKPGRTDIPAMIPQNGALAELLLSENIATA